MKTQYRFQRPEQLNLFHPPRRLPQWKEMSNDVEQNVIDLLAQMLCDHHLWVHRTAKHGEVEDE